MEERKTHTHMHAHTHTHTHTHKHTHKYIHTQTHTNLRIFIVDSGHVTEAFMASNIPEEKKSNVLVN